MTLLSDASLPLMHVSLESRDQLQEREVYGTRSFPQKTIKLLSCDQVLMSSRKTGGL